MLLAFSSTNSSKSSDRSFANFLATFSVTWRLVAKACVRVTSFQFSCPSDIRDELTIPWIAAAPSEDLVRCPCGPVFCIDQYIICGVHAPGIDCLVPCC